MSNRPVNSCWRTITLLLLAAAFFFGIAITAILPPFEGADETAHFSRLQSDSYPVPHPPLDSAHNEQKDDLNTRISTFVFDYYRRGPMPYQWVDSGPAHRNDTMRGGYTTYRDFFDLPSRSADYVKIYQQSPLPADFSPGPEPNWQYQHPPFFYLVMGHVMKSLAGHASLVTTFFVLRLLCFFMAFSGLCIGIRGTWVQLTWMGAADAGAITALGALYPFLAPEFFWEYARLGNDSMCLFFFGIMWSLLLRHIRAPRGDAWLYMGFAMGASLLTKALMVPIDAGILAFLTLHHFLVIRKSPDRGAGWWSAPFKVTGLMLLIGLPIYFLNYMHGENVEAVNFTAVLNTPDAWSLLKQHFSWWGILHNMIGMVQTVVWLFGSWSLIIIDIPMHVALDVLNGAIVLLHIIAARERPSVPFRLPFWTIMPLFVGLLSNVLVSFILQNDDATPGYYLHILAPAFALIYGAALSLTMRKRWSKILTACLCAPVLMLNFFIAWSYMTAFSGCAIPSRVERTYRLHPSDIFGCMNRLDIVISHLKVIAWPDVALVAMGLAFIPLTVAGVLILLRDTGKKSLNSQLNISCGPV